MKNKNTKKTKLKPIATKQANGTFTVPKEAEQFMLDHPMCKK